MSSLKKIMIKMWEKARQDNTDNIFSLLERNPQAKFLDLGCDTGKFTLELAKKVNTNNLYGVEIVDERIIEAKKNGIKVEKSDLNNKLPFDDNFFDVVHANQVIEHLVDVDIFAEEIYRVLKPNGYAVISTENLSSWHNIFALILGFQAFSQHISAKKHVGNICSPHHGEDLNLKSWTHVKIFTYKGLKEFFKINNFKMEKLKGSGYYPLPGFLSRIASKTDPIHSHFITIKVRK